MNRTDNTCVHLCWCLVNKTLESQITNVMDVRQSAMYRVFKIK